jgi:hypothetical protein
MPHLAMIRTDIADGTLQVLDLWPNTSQHSIYDPLGQTKYVNYGEYTGAGQGVARPTTVSATAHLINWTVYGLAAYFVDMVTDDGGTNQTPTALQANAFAALVATNIVQAGAVVSDATLSTQFTAVAGINAGSTFLGSGVSSIADVLQIISGGSYRLPAGSQSEDVVIGTAQNGAFEAGVYKNAVDTGALKISFASGQLASMTAATFDPFGDGTTGAALTAYADDGTLYTG